MADTVDQELIDLIRHFLDQRGYHGATMNDVLREVGLDHEAVYDALISMQDKGEVYYKQRMGYMTWYLNDA